MIAGLLASAAAALAVFAAPPGVAAHASVGCDAAAMGMGAVAPDPSYRIVFGRIAMPRSSVLQVAKESYPLRYWAKAGILIRPGSVPIDLIVPVAWRNRLAIGWGEGGGGGGVASRLHFTGCAAEGRKWLPYAGGFHISAPACAPLIVRTGGRSQTMHFAVGRSCP